MPLSPRYRTIQHVEGSPQEIISRGTDIETLGGQMRESAGVLESIKNRATDQQGKAVDALRESIGDSYSVLYEAADLYEPVGPVIRGYGEALESIKPKIDGHADTCETLWSTFYNLPPVGSMRIPRGAGGWGQPDEGSPEAEQQADEDAAKQEAYENWEAEAIAFDNDYDTWEEAYDDAVQGIGEEMADSIKDSFWDNWGDFIKGFLSWASLILGIAALIIGGPILAALALVAGLAYLAVTIYEYSEGDATGWDIALAALGVLPVGKLANLTKGLHFNKAAFQAMGKGMLGNFGKLSGPAFRIADDSLIGLWRSGGARAGITKLLTGGKGFDDVWASHRAFYQVDDAARYMNSVRNLAGIDFGLSTVGNLLGHYGRGASVTQLTPLPDLPKTPGWVGVGL
ncbi:hypothetical protein IM660_03025 [Ruania alkalisoli]|uniref:Uncharacterized protein n=1 Tax=Ruania alkalisoli TaxID=2779775 RepID=A0A7M1SX29_9MICO|nr:hypothetical protein [Ruania alkalisoli]QOR71292.1 hypothetical protein IM660_03025 [Ruania alkalisoli]